MSESVAQEAEEQPTEAHISLLQYRKLVATSIVWALLGFLAIYGILHLRQKFPGYPLLGTLSGVSFVVAIRTFSRAEIRRGKFTSSGWTRVVGNLILVIALLLSAYIVIASLWPGVLFWAVFFVLIAGFIPGLFLGAAFLAYLVALLTDFFEDDGLAVGTFVRLGLGMVIFTFSVMLASSAIPLKATFRIYQNSFENLIPNADQPGWLPVDYEPEKVGIWSVRSYIRDERGGVYFAIGSSGAGFEGTTHGFAYQPNDEGTPYSGFPAHRMDPITDDWYYFEVAYN